MCKKLSEMKKHEFEKPLNNATSIHHGKQIQ